MKVRLQADTAAMSQLAAKLRQKKNLTIWASKSAVHSTAETIFSKSQITIPRKTGALASSGKVAYQNTDQTSTAIIGYGDSSVNPITGIPTSDYAVAKHEDPRNGKWLENAVLDCSELYRNNLRAEINKSLS